MSKFDASNSQCSVFTFKEGILSAVAHDLKIEVKTFSVDFDPASGSLEASFDPSSLTPLYAVKDGREVAGSIKAKDLKKIAGDIQKKVLETKKYPKITFSASEITADGDGWKIKGNLSLHGKVKSISTQMRREGDRWVTEVTVHQPDFGIKPFSAMFGAIKVKPDLKIVLSVPAS